MKKHKNKMNNKMKTKMIFKINKTKLRMKNKMNS